MTRVFFTYECKRCPGDGVIRARRPGVDWPTPCPCEARRRFSQYQLGRLLGERPATVVRVNDLRSGGGVGARVLSKIASTFPEALE